MPDLVMPIFMTLAQDPKPGGAYETGAAEVRRGPPGAVLLEKSDFLPFLASGVVRMGPDRP